MLNVSAGADVDLGGGGVRAKLIFIKNSKNYN